MSLSVRRSGAWAETTAYVRASGVWKQADGYVRASGVWKQFVAALSVSLSVTSDTETSSTSSHTFTPSNVATVTGGTAPYSYAWSVVNTGSGLIGCLSPTSATTAVAASLVPSGEASEATVTCTVTDANGATASALATYTYNRT